MIWFSLALAGAFFNSSYSLLAKLYRSDTPSSVWAGGAFLFSSLLFFIGSGISGIPTIGDNFFPAAIGSAFINVCAALLYLKAVEKADLSLVTPLLSFSLVFVVLNSFLLLGELPTYLGITGLVLIFLGVYIISGEQGTILGPVRALAKNSGVKSMLVVALLFSISFVLDKVAVVNSSPLFASAIITFLSGVTLLLIAKFQGHSVLNIIKNKLLLIGLASLTIFLQIFFIAYAMPMTLASYVMAVKRSTILFSVLWGGLLLKEPFFKQRLIGASFMLIGLIILLLFERT
ncbi:EamA family transporter [Endozoicomonas sp. SM1973]|uniref:EamA family transporter n=1 Tax=Spartinivicinus marinus TaxID=2994442 RepID=A0A853ICM9_9GAMM|nr:DMT family transporter [Spartinivicinus marinus]MCX4030305.1 DMT family transporter [Spartinivicinus marinus]NYZ69612.1 EamA family transporter [Spartinivicinus marinus]